MKIRLCKQELRTSKVNLLLLIEKGLDVNIMQSGGWTGLHEAALLGNEEIIMLLLKNGANKMIKKNDGKQRMILH